MENNVQTTQRFSSSKFQTWLQNISGLVRLMFEANPLLITVIILTTLVASILPFGSSLASKQIIDGVISNLDNGSTDTALLYPVILFALAIAIAGAITNSVQALTEELLRDLLSHHLSLRILEKAATLDISYFETPRF